jgi:4-phosphopantoate--beta-alanine ligase
MKVDPSHPRYQSLLYRELLVRGVTHGITSVAGLIAHGRGEAFDYLLGERTHSFARDAIRAGVALLLTSKRPIISVNGNVAALVPKEISALAKNIGCPIEINLFHYSKKRAQKIELYFKKYSDSILSTDAKKLVLPNVASNRKITLRDGIASSDCVFVPLEDGDRAGALRKLGKKVITVDLNPLSRTACSATITIVDHISRALPLMIKEVTRLRKNTHKELKEIVAAYNQKRVLSIALKTIQAVSV